jgi:hypothetical protein
LLGGQPIGVFLLDLDTDLAERLGMSRVRDIRKNIIAPNLDELRRLGSLGATNPNPGKPGRPAAVYYLNEEQALLVCMSSRTERAATVRKEVIEVYMAYRRGQLELTEAGREALPNFGNPAAAARAWAEV